VTDEVRPEPDEEELPGRLGDRLPEYRELSERLREINDWSRFGRGYPAGPDGS
jgi:hypothetical protein